MIDVEEAKRLIGKEVRVNFGNGVEYDGVLDKILNTVHLRFVPLPGKKTFNEDTGCSEMELFPQTINSLRPLKGTGGFYITADGMRHWETFGEDEDEDEDEDTQYQKPPLGLRPKFVADEQRRAEIIAAIQRFGEVGKAIPQEWIDEYNSLCEVKNG